MAAWLIVLGVIVLAIAYVFYNYFRIRRMGEGTAEMMEMAEIIRSGAATFLKTEYRTISIVVLLVALVFSLFIDVSMGLLSWMEVGVLPMRLLALAVGCAVLGFGISVEVAPRVLMVPGEGIVQAIAVVTGRQFGNVKTAFDATLVSTALLLSLLFFHRLQGLGIGTIFSALAVGRFVDLYNRRLPLISRISALGART